MKKIVGLVIFSLLLVFQIAVFSEVKDEVISLIKKNIKTAQEENLEGNLETIDSNSPSNERTKELLEYMFNTYDLNYEVKDFNLLEVADDMAKIRYTQTTTKVSGPEFRDNKVDIVTILKKTDLGWKIYSSKINSIEYLD